MVNVIEVESLQKSFGELLVIKNSNFTVKKNEIFGFLGANGAGKTTMFKMLTGLLTKDLGSISVLGKNIDTERNEILKNIGLLIETPVFYEHLSAEDNLSLHLDYMETEADIKNTLNKVGLAGVNNRSVSKFSLGMRARLAIARAIIHDPQILILDEPVNGLDPQGIKDMRILFKRLSEEQGKTLLISSHTLSEVEHIADTIAVLANGITNQASMKDIKEQYLGGLEEYYFNTVGEK